MRTLLTSLGVAVFASGLAFAETWTGRLVDANCAERQTKSTCTPDSSTSAYAIQVSGKTYNFDSAGNRKAAQAMKEYDAGANRSKNPNAQSSPVIATVQGTQSGDEIKVDSIQVR
jgi:hypothetical protein